VFTLGSLAQAPRRLIRSIGGIILPLAGFTTRFRRRSREGLAASGCTRFAAGGQMLYHNRMKCPYCRADNDKVIDSRASEDGLAIRRRRECLACERRFTTRESVVGPSIKVVKKDGGRVPFEREKIRRGLEKACWKRPITGEQIETIVSAIEEEVYGNFDSEVDSKYLGELVMKHLRLLDQVAFVRFASVYREFQDVRDFVHELEPMLQESLKKPHSKQGRLSFDG
jgi:transcriptional repressor NrdR